MGFLALPFLFGALGIGIPIILHLIRRTPQGRQVFSSLMFLSPSPPRLTKRNRFSNILLMILRATAIILLALAFARPYFHWGDTQDKQLSSGRRILFLVDISASMRRPDLWADAKKQVESQLADITPADEVGLYLFDRELHPAFTLAQWNQADPAARLSLFRAALAQASPGWSATRLGDCLADAADLASENNSAAADLKRARTIILITDLQEGAKAQALQGHEWPKDVSVRKLTPIAAQQPGNASLQWIESPPPAQAGTTQTPAAPADGTLRVRVNNASDSTTEQFTLNWHNSKGPTADAAIPVYVAPGRSQVVKIPQPQDAAADRLILTGDTCDFDNTLYIVPPQAETLHALYLGSDEANNPNGLSYYLKGLLSDTPLRKLDLVTRNSASPATSSDLAGVRLVIVSRSPSDAEITLLKSYVHGGGDLLWVGTDVESLERAGAFLGQPLHATEATGEYVLLNRIDLSDPIFAPFTDARYADFSKIHFWKHRQIKWDANQTAPLQAKATFDDGTPYLLAGKQGAGTVYLMTSGWTPIDSELFKSGGKFAPMMDQLVLRKDLIAIGAQYAIDDPISLPTGFTEIISPDGKTTQTQPGTPFTATTQPGIYHLRSGAQDIPIAVNLAPDESRTTPGIIDDLAQWGVQFTTPESTAVAAERQRLLLTSELENKQKTWRWILLGVLGLLAVETALAGRLSRSAFQKRAAT